MKVNDKTLVRVFKIIKDNSPITRTNVAKLAGLSKAMITFHVDELLKRELIFQDEELKKNNKLKINEKKYLAIGVAISPESIKIGIFNLDNTLLIKKSIKIEFPKIYQDIVGVIEKARIAIKDIIKLNKIEIDRVITIGISIPMCVDNKNNKIYFMLFKEELSIIVDSFKKEFNCSIYVENDANLMALAEKYFGCAKDYNYYVFIKVGKRGIGCGIILDGKLFTGVRGCSGEIGHIVVEPKKGKTCFCGNKGCVGTYISVMSIINEAIKYAKSNKSVYLSKIFKKNGNIVLDDIKDAIINNDPYSINLIENIGEYYGIVISNLVNILNLESIIIDGNTSALDAILLNNINTKLHHNIYPLSKKDLNIKYSSLGKDSDMEAAVFFAIDSLLNDPLEFINSIKTK